MKRILTSTFILVAVCFALQLGLGVNTLKAEGPSPDQIVINPELDKDLFDFVSWMRVKGYKENIISKYVHDYMDPQYHELIKTELAKRSDPECHLSSPVSLKYIEWVPKDTNAEAKSANIDIVEQMFEQTFGMNFEIEYIPFQIDYTYSFATSIITEQSLGSEPIVKIAGIALTGFIDSFMNYHFGDEVNGKNHILRLAIEKYNDMLVKSSGLAPFKATFTGNEFPIINDQTSFFTHTHEWLHRLKQSHRYSDIVEQKYSYGTLNPLAKLINKTIQLPPPKLGPLEIYLLEPKEGFDFPENVSAESYFQYLKTLPSEEMPYTQEPNAEIVIAIFSIDSKLNITVKNIGNLPLSLIPLDIEIKEFPTAFSKFKNWFLTRKLPPDKKRKTRSIENSKEISYTIQSAINWLGKDEEITIQADIPAQLDTNKKYSLTIQINKSAPQIKGHAVFTIN